jgi:hypothetical protein
MIKIICFLICLFCMSTTASAKCGSSGIECLNKAGTLSKNAVIILEFYSSSQELVPGLSKKYPVYLQSSQRTIPLMLKEVYKGEMQLTQVVLKMSTEPLAGEKFTLHIGNLPKSLGEFSTYDEKAKRLAPLVFITNDISDREIPLWKTAPAEVKKTYESFGCGPARFVHFSMGGNADEILFARATVTNKTTGKQTIYLLEIEENIVKVGHGMCAGAFHFDGGDQFEVQFQLVDQSGNYSNTAPAINFTSPVTPAYDR